MTVLEAEEDSDERSVPPRKKFCLSLSRRDHNIAKNITQPPHPSTRGGFYEDQDLPYNPSKMLNGYRNQHGNHQDTSYDIIGGGSDGLRIATLCNLGNTCFLNSVIYTLRFAPSFLHNLHHLATDLSNLNDKQIQTKAKSSSLGRTGVSLTSSSNRSWSSKDLSALSGIGELNKPRIQVATEKLHELFVALRLSETRDSCEPYQPDAFLQALRDVNPIFEGNQQQDAHELLVCLLDNIRETFQLLVRHRESRFGQSNGGILDFTSDRLTDMQFESSGSGKRSIRKKKQKKYQPTRGSTSCLPQSHINGGVAVGGSGSGSGGGGGGDGGNLSSRPCENGHVDFIGNSDLLTHRPESKKCFISEDFEGISLLRTTCLECEHVTERKETFCDICVPIETSRSNEKDENGKPIDSSEVYRHSVVTSELLCGRDKYWCASCLRYNEARRAVSFPSLPRLLVLQLKRFSTAAGSMEKINNYMPTPLTLECFCEECSKIEPQGNTSSCTTTNNGRHVYKLYSVIMHQGATSTAGHYIAYTKVPEDAMFTEYFRCDRDCRRHNVGQSGSSSNTTNSGPSSILKYFRSKSNISESKEHLIRMGCRSIECCGIRRVKNTSNTWLECDDELVRAIRERELLDKLAPNPRNSATPYLLFYVRSTMVSSEQSGRAECLSVWNVVCVPPLTSLSSFQNSHFLIVRSNQSAKLAIQRIHIQFVFEWHDSILNSVLSVYFCLFYISYSIFIYVDELFKIYHRLHFCASICYFIFTTNCSYETMKYQQVSVDFVNMVYTACTYLMLAGAAWIFLRLLQACFWLPRHLRKQTDIQQMLQDKVESYEKYIFECEEKEKAAAEVGQNENDDEVGDGNSEKPKHVPIDEEKWKERRECLEMLKKELKRVRDGGELHDWDYLLEDDEAEVNKKDTKEPEGEENDEKKIDECDKEEEKIGESTIADIDYNNSNSENSHIMTGQDSEAKKNK